MTDQSKQILEEIKHFPIYEQFSNEEFKSRLKQFQKETQNYKPDQIISNFLNIEVKLSESQEFQKKQQKQISFMIMAQYLQYFCLIQHTTSYYILCHTNDNINENQEQKLQNIKLYPFLIIKPPDFAQLKSKQHLISDAQIQKIVILIKFNKKWISSIIYPKFQSGCIIGHKIQNSDEKTILIGLFEDFFKINFKGKFINVNEFKITVRNIRWSFISLFDDKAEALDSDFCVPIFLLKFNQIDNNNDMEQVKTITTKDLNFENYKQFLIFVFYSLRKCRFNFSKEEEEDLQKHQADSKQEEEKLDLNSSNKNMNNQNNKQKNIQKQSKKLLGIQQSQTESQKNKKHDKDNVNDEDNKNNHKNKKNHSKDNVNDGDKNNNNSRNNHNNRNNHKKNKSKIHKISSDEYDSVYNKSGSSSCSDGTTAKRKHKRHKKQKTLDYSEDDDNDQQIEYIPILKKKKRLFNHRINNNYDLFIERPYFQENEAFFNKYYNKRNNDVSHSVQDLDNQFYHNKSIDYHLQKKYLQYKTKKDQNLYDPSKEENFIYYNPTHRIYNQRLSIDNKRETISSRDSLLRNVSFYNQSKSNQNSQFKSFKDLENISLMQEINNNLKILLNEQNQLKKIISKNNENLKKVRQVLTTQKNEMRTIHFDIQNIKKWKDQQTIQNLQPISDTDSNLQKQPQNQIYQDQRQTYNQLMNQDIFISKMFNNEQQIDFQTHKEDLKNKVYLEQKYDAIYYGKDEKSHQKNTNHSNNQKQFSLKEQTGKLFNKNANNQQPNSNQTIEKQLINNKDNNNKQLQGNHETRNQELLTDIQNNNQKQDSILQKVNQDKTSIQYKNFNSLKQKVDNLKEQKQQKID